MSHTLQITQDRYCQDGQRRITLVIALRSSLFSYELFCTHSFDSLAVEPPGPDLSDLIGSITYSPFPDRNRLHGRAAWAWEQAEDSAITSAQMLVARGAPMGLVRDLLAPFTRTLVTITGTDFTALIQALRTSGRSEHGDLATALSQAIDASIPENSPIAGQAMDFAPSEVVAKNPTLWYG